jgi:HEAT repeat protein
MVHRWHFGSVLFLLTSVTLLAAQVPPTVPAPGTPAPPNLPVIPPTLPNPGAPGGVPTPPVMTAPPMNPAPLMPGVPGASPVPIDPNKQKWPSEYNGKNISQVITDFRSQDPTVREYAVRSVSAFGPEAARRMAMKAMIPLIEDPDPGIRVNTVLMIALVGFDNVKDATEAMNKIVSVIGKTAKGSAFRLHAAKTLASFGTDAHSTIPTLVNMADDPSWEIRAAIADALGRIGAPVYEEKTTGSGPTMTRVPTLKREVSKSAMQKLNFALISDESSTVRMEACQSLILLGPPHSADPSQYISVAQPFIDKVSARAKIEKDPAVRIWLNLLNMMYDDRIFDANMKLLIAEVKGNDLNLKMQAMNALGILGPKARPALNAMTEALFHADVYVSLTALNNIAAMGDEAKIAIPDVERLIAETKDANMKAYAGEILKGLKRIKQQAPPAGQ